MKVATEACNMLLIIISVLLQFSELGVHSHSYDYSATTECMLEAEKAQYGGGIIKNGGFDENIKGWTVFGNGTAVVDEGISNKGNRFIVVRNRSQTLDSFSQTVQLRKGIIYVFSGWFQLSEGSDTVSVIFKTSKSELVRGGHVIAKHGCWSLLKGGIVANFSSPAQILFESKNPTVEIWADSVSLQPFTKKQWRSHQDHSIERVRKSRVRFEVSDVNETTLEGATILINQTKPGFPFGCGMNHNILTSIGYQKWFVQRFKYTAFTNEMKWYSTEAIQGQVNYNVPDAMMQFAKNNGISVRGHTILWDDQKFQPVWVKTLSPEDLRKAAESRMQSVVGRYKGQLISWDVVNENVHYHFYEDQLGQNASAVYYTTAHKIDPTTVNFMNEFNTIEYSGEVICSPVNYLNKLKEIMRFQEPGTKLGIGLQGHFAVGQPNLAYMRSGLDLLGGLGLPIWLTEYSVEPQPNQAEYFEEILREAYSHPAVQGIIIFAGPAQSGFFSTLLADENFINTPTGDVVDRLIHEWGTGPQQHQVVSDKSGIVDVLLHHGDYRVTVTHPLSQYSKTMNLSVRNGFPQQTIQVKMLAD